MIKEYDLGSSYFFEIPWTDFDYNNYNNYSYSDYINSKYIV